MKNERNGAPGRKKILAVDDSGATLTACKKLLSPHYEVYPASSAKKMFELLEHIAPDLILLDVDMPDINGYEAAGRLKKSDAFKDVPIIFLSGRTDPKSEIFGLSMGALDYIHKPFAGELLLKRIDTHLLLIDSRKKLIEGNKNSGALFRMGEELRASLAGIARDLETAAQTDDPAALKKILLNAGGASKKLLPLVDDMLKTVQG